MATIITPHSPYLDALTIYYEPHLAHDERAILGYQVDDMVLILTNLRVLVITDHGMSKEKTQFMSIPYNRISHFNVEIGNHERVDDTLNLWIMGLNTPLSYSMPRGDNLMHDIGKYLTKYVYST